MIVQIILANVLIRIESTSCDDTFIDLANVTYQVPENETMEDSVIELGLQTDKVDVLYDDSDKLWIKPAINQVGFYLRSHKFNEFDRRFAKNATIAAKFNMYESFPEPPLKYFHWDVFDHCNSDFLKCLRYLYETSLDAHLQYSVDSTTLAYELLKDKDLDSRKLAKLMNEHDEKCKRQRELDFTDPVPFESVLDRFIWRLTASYHMCWYTLKRQPELEYFPAPCDNYAWCLETDSKSPSNHDYRADNSTSFACAMYSFCPDPCCSQRRKAENRAQCDTDASNPCRMLNNKTCALNATLNRSLTSIVYNQWNVTCTCHAAGFEYQSRHGMCVDFDECHQSKSPCDETQDCSNSKGNYFCYCKFGYEWSESQNRCVQNGMVAGALERFLSGVDKESMANSVRAYYLWILINLIVVGSNKCGL